MSQRSSKPLVIQEVTTTALQKDGLLYSPAQPIQGSSAAELQSLGLLYSPMEQGLEANLKTGSAIADAAPSQPSASSSMANPQNALQAQHQKMREAIKGNSNFQKQFQEYIPIIKQLMDEQRRDLVILALFSMERGPVQARDVYNRAPLRKQLFHPLKLEGIRQLFEELEAKGIGEVVGDDLEAYYQAFLRDYRRLSANSNSTNLPEPEPEIKTNPENG